jgi:GT2 family glycosyltransferase
MNRKIALLILNYNNAKDTLKLLESIKNNLSKDYYYFLIDNNSGDLNELELYANKKDCLILDEESSTNCQFIPSEKQIVLLKLSQNYGYAKGNNFGLRLAYTCGFKYAFILNPDVQIKNYKVFDCILVLLEKNFQKVAIAGPRIINPNGMKLGPFRRNDYREVLRNIFYPLSYLIIRLVRQFELIRFGYIKVYSVCGCFFGLNLSLFANVNFFDEHTFLYYEEIIISEKLRRINKDVIYVPSLNVFHNHLYDNIFHQTPFFKESKGYYENRYLKLNNLTKLALKMSNKYYESIWINLKKSLRGNKRL